MSNKRLKKSIQSLKLLIDFKESFSNNFCIKINHHCVWLKMYHPTTS